MILTLKAQDFLRLKEARGVRLKVLRGRAWITENGSPQDSFLSAGTSYAVRGNGLVLVSAEQDGSGEVRLEMGLSTPSGSDVARVQRGSAIA